MTSNMGTVQRKQLWRLTFFLPNVLYKNLALVTFIDREKRQKKRTKSCDWTSGAESLHIFRMRWSDVLSCHECVSLNNFGNNWYDKKLIEWCFFYAYLLSTSHFYELNWFTAFKLLKLINRMDTRRAMLTALLLNRLQKGWIEYSVA